MARPRDLTEALQSMKSIAITLASLLLLTAVSANAQRAITITRRGTPPAAAASPGQGAGASNFTGTVRVEPVFQALKQTSRC